MKLHVLYRQIRHVASTGPRPRGRGNKTLVEIIALDVMLQRGRARAGAEIGAVLDPERETTQASTGPRPRGRGNSAWPARSENHPASFNGAAPARARKCSRIQFTCHRFDSFNGAAPARARKYHDWTADGEGGLEELQRGRARAGAEISCSRQFSSGAYSLQRGRARAGAEI